MSELPKYLEVVKRNPEPEFHQAEEVLESLEPVLEKYPEFVESGVRETPEPDRQIIFKVPWIDDNGKSELIEDLGYSITMHLTMRGTDSPICKSRNYKIPRF